MSDIIKWLNYPTDVIKEEPENYNLIIDLIEVTENSNIKNWWCPEKCAIRK